MRRLGILVGGVALLSSAGPAFGQLTTDQAKTLASSEKSQLPPSTFGGELGFGQIKEDFFLNLNLRLDMDWEQFGFGIQTPVRMRIIDRNPKNDDYLGFIRHEDWDQVSDYFRIIRYVYVGQWDKKGPYYVRLGELASTTVGHGTIMHRYYNTLDLNRWHLGVNAALNVWAVGAEVVINDVTDPWVIGSRVYVRPLQMILGDGFWDKLHVGVSFFTDYKAPFQIATDSEGVPQADEDDVPVVAAARPLFVYGTDIGIDLLANEYLSITPYIDLNKISRVDNGWGFHAGVLWGLHFPLGIDTLTFDLRTEYRRVSGDYLGPYFNTVYEIERYQRLTFGRNPPPKFYSLECNSLDANVCNPQAPPGKNGFFFDLVAGLPQFFLIGGEYIDYDGGQPDGSLRLSLEVPALSFLKLAAFYYRVNVDGPGDLFKLDDKSAIVAQATIPIYWAFSLNLRYFRVWQANGEGGFDTVDDWDASLGFSLEIRRAQRAACGRAGARLRSTGSGCGHGAGTAIAEVAPHEAPAPPPPPRRLRLLQPRWLRQGRGGASEGRDLRSD